jgi:ABC-type transport system involved in multi-copper enzyme maturation permease subunit
MSVTTTAPAKPLITGGLTAAALAAGIGLVVGDAPIPVSGFAVLTVIFSVAGLVLALVLARSARRPRTAFVRAPIVLTALSLVPDVLADASTSTKMLLTPTRLVAATIVIAAMARRLSA